MNCPSDAEVAERLEEALRPRGPSIGTRVRSIFTGNDGTVVECEDGDPSRVYIRLDYTEQVVSRHVEDFDDFLAFGSFEIL